MHLPDDLAAELRQWKLEYKKVSEKKVSPVAVMFPNADGGFMDTANYRTRVLKPLEDSLGVSKDIQSHLWHSRADTTENEYMQELPESAAKGRSAHKLLTAKQL
jgi:hypothetical protein